MVDVRRLLVPSLELVDLCRRIYVADSATKRPVACDAEEGACGSEKNLVVAVLLVFHNLWALLPSLHIAMKLVEAEFVPWIVISQLLRQPPPQRKDLQAKAPEHFDRPWVDILE